MFCFFVFLLVSGTLYAQGGNTVESNPSGSGYRFLDPLSRPRAPGKADEEASGKEEVQLLPPETSEEREAREKIRTVLRLIDGDSIMVGRDVQVKIIGVAYPDFEAQHSGRDYDKLSWEIKKWIDEFIQDPAKALQSYGGGARFQAEVRRGGGFAFYYFYLPDVLLEEIRKKELQRYDDWVKEYKKLPGPETDQQKTKRALADLKQGRMPDGAEKPRDVHEYVISEAKYYYDDGTIKREEIFRDGKIMIKRLFDRQGKLIDETLYDGRAQAYQDLSKKE